MYAIRWTRCTGETGVFSIRYKTRKRAERAIKAIDCRVMSDYRLEAIEIGQ